MNKINNFGVKTLKFLRSDGINSSLQKIKGSIFAIALGLIISILPMLLDVIEKDALIGEAFRGLFILPFEADLSRTLIYIAIFILVGGGVGVSFKTGLFNIGASGQMMLGGGVAIMIGILQPAPQIPRFLWVFILMIISALLGAILAGIAGFLKAFANVHEVITTIMLNWITFYGLKHVFRMRTFWGGITDSKPMPETYKLDLANINEIWFVLFISIAIMLLLAFIFKFTKLGFSMKMNGLNTNAAKYSGINNKMTTIYSMLISGALAGLGGYFLYAISEGKMPELRNLEMFGFEAITVTLLSFSSPLGSIPAGIFYGTFKKGSGFAYGIAGMSRETFGLAIGIVIFTASIAPILVNVKPYKWLKESILSRKIKSIEKEKNILNNKLKELKLDYKNNKSKYLVEQKQAKLNFDSERSKNTEMSEFELAKKVNYHKGIKKHILIEYKNALNSINQQFKENKISSLSDLSVQKRDLLNKLIDDIKIFNIDYLETEKIKYKSNTNTLKSNYKLFKNEAIQKYNDNRNKHVFAKIYSWRAKEIQELKKERDTKIQELKEKNLDYKETKKEFNNLIKNKELELWINRSSSTAKGGK
ncbi:ABC transporter permease [Mycoplasma sp. Mirounga ES2805-ORL]|uniref:ABC transporter permease n=1 Tax=Mycoplasma sp. Mirounga ES2805-ORL TaxID=754514 RepID=UPI00197CAF40|nr:ABC transporter permease [Mycoplasma sp. Mirounga ES2805-ORL]QSF13786.1 hypothetical protein JXZ90_00585 [Mycoplasma sp. Mirounga ES2805-ORL]